MKAIIFTSNAGTTKRYAYMLADKLGIPAYSSNSIPKSISAMDEIIYFGWLMAGGIKGYKKVNKKYNIVTVCAVGMATPSDKILKEIKEKNNISEKLFYLQGGFDIDRLSGLDKLIMTLKVKMDLPKLEKQSNRSPEDEFTYKMLTQGADCVSEEKLIPIINTFQSA